MSKLAPNTSSEKRARRHKRIRAKVRGTATRPRLAVYRSNRAISAQLINDETGTTLAASRGTSGSLMQQASTVGAAIAVAAKAQGITMAVFDRAGFTYTGRVKALAEAARENGLTF